MASNVTLTCTFCSTPANWGCSGKSGYATCPKCRASGDVRREHISETPHWAPGFPKPPKPVIVQA